MVPYESESAAAVLNSPASRVRCTARLERETWMDAQSLVVAATEPITRQQLSMPSALNNR